MKDHFSHVRFGRNRVKIISIAFFASVVAISHFAFPGDAATQNRSKQKPAQRQPPKVEDGKQGQDAQRFDLLVREDFFAGLAGDQQRFDKAMKFCEETLAKNPRHAEAMVWHGTGVFTRAGWLFQKGDIRNGGELWQRGMDEINAAVALEPDNVGVLLPRGAAFLEASKHVPMPAIARELLETAVNDYEKVLKLQQSYFHHLSTHARGELLLGLASGWHRLGDQDKARIYFHRLVKELAGTSYGEKAKAWLEKKTLPQNHNGGSCTGCHVR